MKSIIKMLKPWIKKILIAQLAANEEKIITMILVKSGNKIPLAGEQLEQTVKVLYDALEEIITTEIERI
jgi:hypothetical protein